MLARVLVTEADVLLLDEPTNHLDLARIGQLENWLNALPREMPVVIASHDRAFLDATTNRTLFLRPEQSQIFSLPYTRARAALREADASDERRYQRDLKTAQQLAPAGGEAQQYRHQFRKRPAVVEDAAIEAARREAGGCSKAGAPRTVRRHDQARQSRNPRKSSAHARGCRGRDARWPVAVSNRQAVHLQG